MDHFHTLVADLNRVLGPDAGINSEGVDPKELIGVMEKYISDESEWKQYALGDKSRAYTRNLVDKGNANSNLLLLVWSPGQQSPIHDHANAHCIMKVLRGSLKETRFAWPDPRPQPLQVLQETVYHENEVTYMSDQLGLHCIQNMDPEEFTCSLHLYTPPNAQREGCHIFKRDTGESSHVMLCNWYSELGQKLDPGRGGGR
ncbi:cysteine dioxygenase [Eremomyces bilateralis CBS 781.70]|uniref:Cysteine dioxygenase n=1 Tax=Eremomyces bilateralis CBS 781.70 TaxID=1392243 RepID=A0A6G1GEH3_9PEZI|nr:cysteine dioxygenase [Eremomyces bilateralis CBS 781.70]KAF1816458.1 cysteine dioxygenase [Eremomyces bilateralis CBS 781.70]